MIHTQTLFVLNHSLSVLEVFILINYSVISIMSLDHIFQGE